MLNTVKPLRPHCKHSCRAAALLSSVSWLDSRPLLTWNYSNYLQINIKLIQQSNSSVMAASCTSAADISKGVIIILRNKTYLSLLKSTYYLLRHYYFLQLQSTKILKTAHRWRKYESGSRGLKMEKSLEITAKFCWHLLCWPETWSRATHCSTKLCLLVVQLH